MGGKAKTNSLAVALGRKSEITEFLEAGTAKPRPKQETPVERVQLTVRIPKDLAHALIDASAERRKSKVRPWSQQDIVAEALEKYLVKRPD